ncbi:MAG: hypothetical protein SGPRY_013354 [Prymnesium sp.]
MALHSSDPADDTEDSWVEVVAPEGSLESLSSETITHVWLGFFDGPAETARGIGRTFGPDGGSPALGIRHVSVEMEATASSNRLRTARPLLLWLEEATWRSP